MRLGGGQQPISCNKQQSHLGINDRRCNLQGLPVFAFVFAFVLLMCLFLRWCLRWCLYLWLCLCLCVCVPAIAFFCVCIRACVRACFCSCLRLGQMFVLAADLPPPMPPFGRDATSEETRQ